MGKYAAFGVHLEVGTAQVETNAVLMDDVDIATAGDADVTVTSGAVGASWSPKTIQVALAEFDTADMAATKIIAGLTADGDINALYSAYGSGNKVILRLRTAEANDATLNILIEDGTNGACAGLTTTNSTNTVAGIDKIETAGVKNVGGPGLSVDTEEVTTHDQVTAWEQVVAAVIRSGEVSLDIVYDPADDTQDGTAAGGLLYRMKNRTLTFFDLIFRGTDSWQFFGYVNGFEPTGDVAGALTATVKAKIAEAPVLS